ncbi:hypothetical protein [Colwellia sp. 12G3]|uniref:hypothetical protein n=1 Tax=Colwellia sp. 12G3 TaxID=2058299 RepID=UPI000C32F43D|nr:hypothetical protein [Colwellia sp. 12G3]PKI13150.1 hypothetical protein CXF71_20880 [Colwellia sp. 12G3]
MKLLKNLILVLCLLTTSYSHGTLLTDNDYITVDHSGIELDWVWASDYNVEFYIEDGVTYNQLLAPEVLGWREATTTEFDFFRDNITSASFRRSDSSYKNAARFFNINRADDYTLSTTDFSAKDISGNFREGTVLSYDPWSVPDNYWFDTFYVRDSLTQGPAPKPIPEPLTIIIFATALIILQTMTKRKSA